MIHGILERKVFVTHDDEKMDGAHWDPEDWFLHVAPMIRFGLLQGIDPEQIWAAVMRRRPDYKGRGQRETIRKYCKQLQDEGLLDDKGEISAEGRGFVKGYKKAAVDLSIPKEHRLYAAQQGRCNGCRVLFHLRNLEKDHKVPASKGGGDQLDNLQLLCRACNSDKGTGTDDELVEKLRELRFRQL